MSRTIRRNKRHLIRDNVGTLDKVREDFEQFGYTLNDRYTYRKSDRGLTVEQIFAKKRNRYISDCGWRSYGNSPSWWANLMCHRPERRFNKRELLRCVRRNEWDDHFHDAGYYLQWYC